MASCESLLICCGVMRKGSSLLFPPTSEFHVGLDERVTGGMRFIPWCCCSLVVGDPIASVSPVYCVSLSLSSPRLIPADVLPWARFNPWTCQLVITSRELVPGLTCSSLRRNSAVRRVLVSADRVSVSVWKTAWSMAKRISRRGGKKGERMGEVKRTEKMLISSPVDHLVFVATTFFLFF